MSNTEGEKAREEKALDALIAAAFKEDPTDAEADDKQIERYGNALTDDDRKKLDDAGKGFLDSLFAGETKTPKERAPQTLSTAMNRGDAGATLSDRASEEKARKIREAKERRKALTRNVKIQEHDMVRVRDNFEVEGYSLRAGMLGTVVSIYRDGEAFAVEFPELERGSAVVTLYREQVELAEATDE